MTLRPIQLVAEMVRATLDGSKTQTRRPVRMPKRFREDFDIADLSCAYDHMLADDGSCAAFLVAGDHGYTDSVNCPFGAIGDRLYVRERVRVIDAQHMGSAFRIRVSYEADGDKRWLTYPERLKYRPVVYHCLPNGCFREASRITLEVTDVRVQRVQDISNDDIRAEGIDLRKGGSRPTADARERFHALWDSIYAEQGLGWDTNCWVWVGEFRRVGQ